MNAKNTTVIKHSVKNQTEATYWQAHMQNRFGMVHGSWGDSLPVIKICSPTRETLDEM